ncbi:MAG: Glycoside hydrolase family 57 [Candidatus Gallionella acididurans]|uniref:Glycoside hydrolase family 57 n=1 Tax=Candidatus Gallionella acididurans TaxID=1796491 RepID=A0A139BSS9_9PROT|nr:MAG: Glycoside hydrolase family 57 [Candidatus Gallionella acididurans]
MKKPVDLVFLWHMHQPDYRDYSNGDFVMPWTYLHAIKDYTDMAYHLERHPKVCAVVNFVPILLEQLEDYADQFASGQLRDPLLRMLVHEDSCALSAEQRQLILDACFRSNHTRMVAPYPAYKRLHELFNRLQTDGEAALSYLSGQFMADLLTWYHLAWCGESVRREHTLVVRLMSKAEGFTYEDRKQLFDLLGELIAGIIPRYRKLAESGQIEISATPYYHPLAPLLIDFACAKEAMPDAPMPQAIRYPAGKIRVAAHVDKAKKSHAARFGSEPAGMWPAEGSISTSTLEVLAEQGCQWAASGEGVLVNSLHQSQHEIPDRAQYLYRPYKLEKGAEGLTCFFRDDRLSDLIGFEYSRWHGQDAALNFVEQILAIANNAPTGETPVVSVILDGENAWEYYPYNGFYFLDELYSALEAHPDIHTSTYREYLKLSQARSDVAKAISLPGIVAGSWVYGDFSTWIGSKDKNRAWDLLCVAKQSYDMVMASGRLSQDEQAAAEKQLFSCESSDWFWWFGDYNPSHAVVSFDRLFRHNLTELYHLLKLPAPQNLSEPISQGSVVDIEVGGAMRRAAE